jgi:hypothetical protein
MYHLRVHDVPTRSYKYILIRNIATGAASIADNLLIREFPYFTNPESQPPLSSSVANHKSRIMNHKSSLPNTIPSFSKSFVYVPFFGTLLKPLILLVFTFSWHALAFGLKVH